jgi:hypothetical protein
MAQRVLEPARNGSGTESVIVAFSDEKAFFLAVDDESVFVEKAIFYVKTSVHPMAEVRVDYQSDAIGRGCCDNPEMAPQVALIVTKAAANFVEHAILPAEAVRVVDRTGLITVSPFHQSPCLKLHHKSSWIWCLVKYCKLRNA